MAKTSVGTPYYMSPELVEETGYDELSDIWSLGVIIYELTALRPPFTAPNYIALSQKIRKCKYERIPGTYSEDLWYVIQRMLTKEPQ